MASKLSRNTNSCCVDGCYNKQKDPKLSFFMLPRDSETRNKWLEVIGRPDLLNKPDLKPQSYKICSVHFEKSMMSEVLLRKLLPGAIPTKFLLTDSQPSTSTYVKESQRFAASTQTKHSYLEDLSVVKTKNASMSMVHTKTDSPINERETQTSLAISSGTPSKGKLITQLQESEINKYLEDLPVVKTKNASMSMVHPQTDSPINERETQTSLAISSGTPSKGKLITQLQESEINKYLEDLPVVKTKNASMSMVHTQTDSPINERETQTSLALSSGTPRKGKLISQLQESEIKKRKLENELDTTQKETDAKNSLSCPSSGNQSDNGDDDEDTEKSVNKKVESSAGASVHYVPTLWYYKHLNFLSGKKDTDSDDSDSDHTDDTVYVKLPRGQKRQPTTSTSTDQEGEPERDQDGDSVSSVDASAAAFGRSVAAQLHHLSKMQRCIAEKLISDVIYHAKMEQLSLDTSINVKEAVVDQTAILIPKAGPSWYDTDLDNGAQESSLSCPLPTETTEDLVRREMEETQSAVNFIKMESDDTENYVFQDDEDELNHAIDIVKEESM